MDVTQFPQVGNGGLRRLFLNSVRVTRPLFVLGYPGIGKTAMMGEFSRAAGRELVFFDLGNGAREDVMLPVKVTGPDGSPMVVRVPLEALARACAQPVTLFIDELTRADKNKQAVALALTHERRIGSYLLHPGTVVVLAGNDTSSSGTFSVVDALVNRCCVVRLVPERDEIRNVIANLATLGRGDMTPGPFLADVKATPEFLAAFDDLCQRYASMAGSRVELVKLAPPEGASETCEQWASPRAIHHALERMAANDVAGLPRDEVLLAELGGCLGREAAAAWWALLKAQDKLPTPEEIQADPLGAKLPVDAEAAVACLGVLRVIAKKAPNPAWQYIGRFRDKYPEMQAVIAKDLLTYPPTDPNVVRTVFNEVAGHMFGARARAREVISR